MSIRKDWSALSQASKYMRDVSGLDLSLEEVSGLYTGYSEYSVGTSFPISPSEGALFYNSSTNKLYKRVKTRWKEIDWQTIIKASPEWIAGRLRINSTTGKLEISPDGTNWYECIPAVSSNAVELATVDNSGYSYKYWISPGQTVIIRNANHVPIVYAKDVVPFFSGSYIHSYVYDHWVGVRPFNIAISDGDGQHLEGSGINPSANRSSSLSIVPIMQHANFSPNWANFEMRVATNNKFYINGVGLGWSFYVVTVTNSSGTAASISYWLGTWYNKDGAQFTVDKLTLTRRA